VSQAAPSADEARHRLYEIMKQEGDFETKAGEALDLGAAYLGVDSGFVTRVDRGTDHWETIVSTDDADGLVPTGATQPLSGAYCRHTLERDSPLAVHDVSDSETLDPDGPLNCYHGTTLTVDGEPYGTVCFVAREVREQPFDDAETMFAELVGRLLEHELERRRQQENLARQTSMINVLDRVLRHNIRNDVTVIRAMGQLLREQRENCSQCATIIERSDALIDMSETARHLGKLINEGGSRRSVDVATLLERVAAEIGERHPAATITVDAPEQLVVDALPSLETALRELLDNAAKHGGERPQVRATVSEREDSVELTVRDDGPGLPEAETDVLQTGTETQLVHGSGLGLWSVYWIVTSHGGEVDISTTDGTTVRLSLPRAVTEQVGEPAVPRGRDRYRSIFEGAPVGLLLVDDEGWIVEANGLTDDLLGHPHGVDGHRFGQFCADDGALATLLPAADGDERSGTLTLDAEESENRRVRYVATRDVVPGQHLFVLQEGES